MTDDDPRPKIHQYEGSGRFEGPFRCKLFRTWYVRNDVLGWQFTSRTASHDVTIGLPRVDTTPDQSPRNPGAVG